MGFVFQAFHLLPHLSALQNVMVPCLLGGQSGKACAESASSLLCDLGLQKRLNAQPASLSGGEQQRVALARALVHNPKVVFADEPTGNLDTATAANTLALLIDLCTSRQTSLVVVTHSDDAARSMGRPTKAWFAELEGSSVAVPLVAQRRLCSSVVSMVGRTHHGGHRGDAGGCHSYR
jgi:predicted ABC-type transport system involved in lysophospholipase L1 biosynthesis ATPase subunit